MPVYEKPSTFFPTFERKPGPVPETTHYCPGCGHGVVHKLLAEAISDMDIQDRVIMMAPVGCAVFLYYYFDVAAISAPHGRAPALATGISRVEPESVVISYQGDGDLAAIGTNNALHAANRGENLLVLFVNNNIYGMTGGQLAPTTLLGQRTVTSPDGRDEMNDGPPLRMAELIATLDAPVLVARTSVSSPKNVRKTRELIRRGLQIQVDKKGYTFIEILSQCPTNWHMSAPESCEWIDEEVTQHFPLGTFKDIVENSTPKIRTLGHPEFSKIAEVLGLSDEGENAKRQVMLPFESIRLKCAGFGGQGVLSLGLMVAHAAMKSGMEVTWLPSYGPEMRGGVANCSVVFSRSPIGTPVVDEPNVLMAMNRPSLEKFGPLVPEDGYIVYNSSLVDTVPEGLRARTYALPATEIARGLGNIKTANTVALGFLAGIAEVLPLEIMEADLKAYFASDALFEMNIPSLRKGWELAQTAQGE